MVLETILFAVGISSVVSYETTGKGLADHTISAVSGKDCKIARSFKGDDICEPQGSVVVQGYTSSSNTVNDYEKILAQRKGAR